MSNPPINPNSDFPKDDLVKLLALREKKDFDAFIEEMYEVLTGSFRNFIEATNISKDKRIAFEMMIEHYQQKEEYEKCAVLYKLVSKLCNK